MSGNGTAWPADAVQRVPIKTLTGYPTNARTHSAGQIDQLAASIREWGWTVPVLVDVSGTVIAGHGRIEAAKQLGLDEVPVMVAKGWSAKQIKAYRLADNQLALNAAWDVKLLAAELGELTDMQDLIGFSEDHLILGEYPSLPNGDRAPFQQMTFTLHDDQAEQVKAAIDAAKALGGLIDGPNENSNGNALTRICESFLNAQS